MKAKVIIGRSDYCRSGGLTAQIFNLKQMYMNSMELQEHPERAIVGNNVLPAYFSDFDCVNHLHKAKSGYYVRVKGWNDGVDKICNPPTKEGYYHDEYMSQYRLALSGLPF